MATLQAFRAAQEKPSGCMANAAGHSEALLAAADIHPEHGIADPACTVSVCGEEWLDRYRKRLELRPRRRKRSHV